MSHYKSAIHAQSQQESSDSPNYRQACQLKELFSSWTIDGKFFISRRMQVCLLTPGYFLQTSSFFLAKSMEMSIWQPRKFLMVQFFSNS